MQDRDHTCEIVRIDPDVAVSKNDDVMPDVRRHVDQVADLAVGAMERRIDDELDVARWQRAAQTLDHRDGGVVSVGDAADDLHGSGVALLRKRHQVVVETGVVAMERLEDRHGRCGRWRAAFVLARSANQDRCREQITAPTIAMSRAAIDDQNAIMPGFRDANKHLPRSPAVVPANARRQMRHTDQRCIARSATPGRLGLRVREDGQQ